MEEAMEEQERFERAQKRVKELRDFYSHLLVYLAVNLGLFLVDLLTSPGVWWFYWPLLGWGIGVLIQGLSVFGGGVWGRDWERRKIQELMEKDRQQGPPGP